MFWTGEGADSKVRPSPMKNKSILALMTMATVVPELFTGSTPLPAFILNPGLLLLLILGYGLAVLLVRELWVRCGAGLGGMFVMGMGYSLFNEGLLDKTHILIQNLPIKQYDNYGYALGLSFPWMAGIGVWHACASVLFPVLLTHRLFPESSTAPWINGKLAGGLGALLLAFGCAGFVHPSAKGVTGTPAQLVELLTLMLLLFGAGAMMKGRVPDAAPTKKLWPFLFGLSVKLPFLGLMFLAARKAPLVVFFGALAAVVGFYAWQLQRRRWLAMPGMGLFALGWYLHNVLLAAFFLTMMGKPLLAATTLAVDAAVMVALFRYVVCREAGTDAAVPAKPA